MKLTPVLWVAGGVAALGLGYWVMGQVNSKKPVPNPNAGAAPDPNKQPAEPPKSDTPPANNPPANPSQPADPGYTAGDRCKDLKLQKRNLEGEIETAGVQLKSIEETALPLTKRFATMYVISMGGKAQDTTQTQMISQQIMDYITGKRDNLPPLDSKTKDLIYYYDGSTEPRTPGFQGYHEQYTKIANTMALNQSMLADANKELRELSLRGVRC